MVKVFLHIGTTWQKENTRGIKLKQEKKKAETVERRDTILISGICNSVTYSSKHLASPRKHKTDEIIQQHINNSIEPSGKKKFKI